MSDFNIIDLNETTEEITEEKESEMSEKELAYRPKKRRKKRKSKAPLVASAILITLVIAALLAIKQSGYVPLSVSGNDISLSNVIMVTPEPLPDKMEGDENLGADVIKHIFVSAKCVENAYNARPQLVDLTEENTSTFAKIDTCAIDTENGGIDIGISADGMPRSDDKYYYLFELEPFENEIPEESDYIAKKYKNDEVSFDIGLNSNSTDSRLYKKFAVAVRNNEGFTLVSTPSYVTNPEAVAKYNNVFMNPSSKKGILLDYGKRESGQLEDLGVAQVAMNFVIADFLGPTTNAYYPTVHYTYNGKTYAFDGYKLSGFDATVKSMTDKGISVTAILLNKYSSSNISMIHPDARNQGVCPYYMFNAATKDGVEMLAAVGSFFADRYSGGSHGKISNWVIANEINARKEWNYMKYTDVDTYTKAYADGFRVLYNAIKSTSSSARVYISLDQQWNRDLNNNPDYDGKDVIDSFNAYISSSGNIDWGLAYHPYNVPLTSCSTWNSSKYISHTSDTSMISMNNIEVLVNYMNQDSFKAPSGETRSIMITELGYTSSGSGGESYQAAAIAYAFYKINHYQDIDGLLLNRQTDDATEIAQGLATGVTSLSGAKKKSYEVFKYMDTDQFEEHAEFAKSIIGINSWSEIMR